MRKELTRFLAERFFDRLAVAFPQAGRLDEGKYFNGSAAFQLVSMGSRTFFVAIAASDDNDTFRMNFAWSALAKYPAAPFGDIKAALPDYVNRPECEFQLAVLNPAVIPWTWSLDETYARWHSEMVRLQGLVRPGDQVAAEAFARHLRDIPKRCSIGSAKLVAEKVVVDIVGYLDTYGKPLIRLITHS